MKEIWKNIKNYEDYYEISNLGNFRSKTRIIRYRGSKNRIYPGKILKKEDASYGYQRIVLSKNHIKTRFMCHRLVAETFIDNKENKPFVNHLNGIKNDNKVSNLEWCTQSENELHSFRVLHNTMKNKTFPKKVKCLENSLIFPSMLQCIKYIGNNSCVEGLKKSIQAKRKYHNLTFIYI